MNPVNYTLESIRELVCDLNEVQTVSVVCVDFKSETSVLLKDDVVLITPIVKYICENGIRLRFSAEFRFHVDRLKEIVHIASDASNMEFAVDIIPELLRTSLDTLRGIIFIKTESLTDFPLPILDNDSLMRHNSYKVVL